MLKQNLLQAFATFCFSLLIVVASGQTTSLPTELPFDDLPPTPEVGKCFAKCRIPDRYETVNLRKMIKPAGVRYETVPAVYKNVQEQVMIKEASTKMVPVPAVYETVTERVMIKEASNKRIEVPASYRTVTEQILVKPEKGEWVRKLKDPNCFSANPEDCYIMCYETIPAEYKTITKQELVSAARTRTTEIPAEYQNVTTRVLKTPATVREVVIPAEYKTVTKRVLVTPATEREIQIPAQYVDVAEKRLAQQGGYTEWTEVLCASKTSNDVVRDVQRELKRKGYDPGPIDGVLGIKTQTALKQYQIDNNLPVGNLNIPTLTKMGIKSTQA